MVRRWLQLVAMLLVLAPLGCSQAISQSADTGRVALQMTLANVEKLRAEYQPLVLEAKAAAALDAHYSDFVGPDGEPVKLTKAQLAAKRAALPGIIAKIQTLREEDAAMWAAVTKPAAQADRQFQNIIRTNNAWWRFWRDPATQQMWELVMERLDTLGKK